ncbi:MAG: DUF4011 domain-containing protein, partial [Clostridia bacterium]|nr:DUF4011 domain-containing protein [Clostridia bacterium]
NTTDNDIENLDVAINAIPAFALPFNRHIDCIPANKTVTLTRPEFHLNAEFLAGMTEKVTGILRAELKKENGVIAADNAEVTVFSFDQWQGLGLYPELLASFVTPNHPALAVIIARAAEFMTKWSEDSSMDGYQSRDPDRVLKQAAAIFAAIKEQGIAYVSPPAGFERTGQRVRLCDTVLQHKMGSCLDLTLLYASCLEAVGLHPILITAAGHVFAGVWLEEKMFPESVQDDSSLITKRLAPGVNEIAVVETTAVTTRKDLSFDDAKALGEQNMISRQVEYIIDVHRARMSRIYPLPQRVATEDGWEIVHDSSFKEENMSAPAALGVTVAVDADPKKDEIQKIVQWERKLLDLGLRNNLINLRITKNQLPVLANSLDELEYALSEGSIFSILPKPADLKIDKVTFEALNEMGSDDIIKAEFENNRLRSVLTEGELSEVIKGLYRTSRTVMEENGANALYLALGMLKWFESDRSTKARYAPIILLPIEMVRKSAAQGFVIRLRDLEPQVNVTLLEKLKQDFGITVKGLDPLPCDEHGIDIRRVLTVIRKAVMEQPHWDVLETACLGIFSFSQFVMWNDIRNRTDDLMGNKVVRSLIEGKLCWEAEPLEMGERVDEDNVMLPMPADASQLYAIRIACDGESFVLHGPPGTGKSQTITSLIANALVNGKTILFVAEKMAALEVVQRRLESIGLGPFCLELHSNKSKKKDVLEQLREVSEITKTQSAEEFAVMADQIAVMRAELDRYAEQLHKVLLCGSTLYSLISEYEYYKNDPDTEPFDPDFIKGLDKAMIDSHQPMLEKLFSSGEEIGHPHGHPLWFVGCTRYSQNLRNSLKPVIDEYMKQIDTVKAYVKDLVDIMGERTPESFDELNRLAETVSYMTCWYDMPPAWSKTTDPDSYFDGIIELAEHALYAKELEDTILQSFNREIFQHKGTELFCEYEQACSTWFLPKIHGMKKLTNKLNRCSRGPIAEKEVCEHVLRLKLYQKELKAESDLLLKYKSDLGDLYVGKHTDWNKILELATTARRSAAALFDIYGGYDTMNSFCGLDELKEAVFGLDGGIEEFTQSKTAFDDLLTIAQCSDIDWLTFQTELCNTVLEHSDELKEWIAYVGVAADARAIGLGNAVDSYESGTDPDTVFRSYKKALLCGLISDAIAENEVIDQFSGAVFNKKLDEYRRMDREWTRLTRQEMYCRLASRVTNFTREAANSSDLCFLHRFIKRVCRV